MSDKDREAFQQWFASIDVNKAQSAWDIWQAATAAKDAEIERLTEVLRVRSKQIGVACLKHDLTHALACGHCHTGAQAEIARLQRVGDEAKVYLKELDWHIVDPVDRGYWPCSHDLRQALAAAQQEG